jgi:hypothetical protein
LRLVRQQLRRFESAETGADDNDMRWRLGRIFHSLISYAESGCHEAKLRLSSAPYAETDFAQQNSKISLEAVQDHRDGESDAPARFAEAPAFVEERQAQTPHVEVGRSR